MKRLLRISFDLSLLSFIPIISWFLLGIIVDKNLINIFTLTYPLQFIYYIIKSIFSTGANISKEKDKNFTDYGPIRDNDCVHENTHTRCLFFYFIRDLMTGRTICI